MKNSLFLLITATISLSAMEDSSIIKINAIQKSHRLKDVSLYKDREGFQVIADNKIHAVNPAFIDPFLNKMTPKQLINFQKHGYIDITRMNDGSYALRAKVRGNGGGPVTGNFLYWLTKSVAYGGIAAATGTALIATGGTAAAAIGGGTAASMAGAGAATAVGYGAATTTALGAAMSTGGATIIGGAIASSASATSAAALTTGAAITASGGCVATMMTTIEAAALGLGALGTLCPWLP